jgi:type I restriction enzyme S subunit
MELKQSLPNGWHWKKLIDIAEENKNAIVDGPFGSNLKVSDYIEGTDGVPVLTTKNLDGVYNDNTLRYISFEKFKELRRSEVRGGDILVAKIGSCGKTGIYPKLMPSAIIPANLLKISVKDSVNKMYVYYYLNSIGFKRKLDEITTATAQPAFAVTKFRKLPIPIPDRHIQDNIVSKIEELFSQLDAGVAGLKRVKSELQRYRASVLKAAFEGRLVPQDPNDEPAKEFLNNLGIKLLDKGKSRFIPKSWELTRLENCVDILDRKRIPINSKEREKRISGKNFSNLYPYYGATGQVGWIDDYLFDEELVLLGEDGAPFLDINKDKAYIVKGKFWVNNHAHVLRAKDGLITNRFLLHYLNCFDFRDFVTGTTRLKLNQTRMKSIPIIIPPINEQNRIVEEIDRRLSIVQEIEKSFDTCLRNSQLVKNSILKSAFDGELIDQN